VLHPPGGQPHRTVVDEGRNGQTDQASSQEADTHVHERFDHSEETLNTAVQFHGQWLTVASSETTDAAFIPDRAVVLGVASRTTLSITGATSYGIGINGDSTQFGNLLGIALGSTNNGVIGPTAFYANTKVRVTANGGNFTAGKVRLIVYFLEMSVPGT